LGSPIARKIAQYLIDVECWVGNDLEKERPWPTIRAWSARATWSGVSTRMGRPSAPGVSSSARPPAARSWGVARRAWPYHYHLANEEAIYVLEGSGTLRIGGEEIRVSQGDYVALPARAQAAHQIVNDSGAVLRYLCFSTMVEPDVMVYPDSGKVGIFAGCARRTKREENLQQVPPRGGRGRLL
jgi:mannose-6-phosphate isomerase-like protein (cupin superfamily)